MKQRGIPFFRAAMTGLLAATALCQPAYADARSNGEWVSGFDGEEAGEDPARTPLSQQGRKLALLQPADLAAQARQGNREEAQIENASPDDDGIFVGAIAVSGADNLPAASYAAILEENIGRELREEDMRRVTQQIADAAREGGLIFATARVPEQSVHQGILQIELNEGRIDDVRIIGSDNRALENILTPLVGQVAIRSELTRRVLLANDLPQIRILNTRMLTENGSNILEITAREDKLRAKVTADNYGSRNLGPARVRLSVDYAGIISDSDQIGISVRTNPISPDELLFANAYYSIGVGNAGTRVGIAGSIGKTEGGDFGSGNVEGDSRYVEVSASHPLHRASDKSLWVNGKVAYLDITREDALGIISADTQVTLSAGLAGNIKLLGGRLRAHAFATQGLGLLGTTRLGDPLSSRFDGDGVFTKGTFYADWRGKIAGPVGAYLRIDGQIANRPLLSSQEYSIGGAFSARGFDFSELSGDNGFRGLVELNYTMRDPFKWMKRLQPYIFLDGGYVNNIDLDFGDGALLSSGVGMRADIGKFNLEIESAVPLNRDRDQSSDRSPHINLKLGVDL